MTMFSPPFRLLMELKNELWPGGYKYGLEAPINGSLIKSFSVELRGFILRPSNLKHLGKPHSIEFKVNGSPVWRCSISLPRQDLLAAETLKGCIDDDDVYCGFNTIIPSFLGSPEEPIELVVTCGQQTERRLSFIFAIVRFEAIDQSKNKFSDIALLNINSMGRSGSSLFCKLLDHHHAFFVPKSFGQYGEISVVNHCFRAISVLCSEGAYSQLNIFEPYADFLAIPTGYFHLDVDDDAEYHINDHLLAATRRLCCPC